MNTHLLLAAAVTLAGAARAQQDASPRRVPVSGPARHARLDVATGAIFGEGAGKVFLGSDVLYNNTCTSGAFMAMTTGETFVDNGQLPGLDNAELEGCAPVYLVDSFEFAYCTDHVIADWLITFHSLHENCTDLTGSPGIGFPLFGLPGSSTGAVACWVITVDLAGTSLVFPFLSDGDGVHHDDPAQDTFGVSYTMTNLLSTGGPMLAGSPIRIGQGCDFAVGTVFGDGDLTGADPGGTGYGSADSFGIMQSGFYAGCFDLGGWPEADWSSFYLRLTSPDSGCITDPVTPLCFGDGSQVACPCGNESDPGNQEGCKSSAGHGARLNGAPLTGTSVSMQNLVLHVTQLPPVNPGMFLASAGVGQGTPAFDGVACVAGGLRLNVGFETLPGQRFSNPPGPLSLIGEGNTIAPGFFQSGQTYYFQYWTRDTAFSPCGTQANFSAAGAVQLTP